MRLAYIKTFFIQVLPPHTGRNYLLTLPIVWLIIAPNQPEMAVGMLCAGTKLFASSDYTQQVNEFSRIENTIDAYIFIVS